jgi:hypothetical protein
VFLDLLHGAYLESPSCKYGVTVRALSQWREALLAADGQGLKIRQEDLADEQDHRTKSIIAELAMENGPRRERSGHREDYGRLLWWSANRPRAGA